MSEVEYLYKYNPIAAGVDCSRIPEVLNTGELYSSSIKELNDPMEGKGVTMSQGYAGVGISMRAGCTPRHYLREVMAHRVLCFTEKPTSLQMWAHYASGYSGVCLQFKVEEMECETHKVDYVIKPERILYSYPGTTESLYAARKALLTKHIDWSYEREHRALFFEGEEDTIANPMRMIARPSALIIGEECESENQRVLHEAAKQLAIPVYQTYIADLRYKVKIIPYKGMRGLAGEDLDAQIRRECEENGIPCSAEW